MWSIMTSCRGLLQAISFVRSLLLANPYTPICPRLRRPDATTRYWRFTKHPQVQGRWTGNTGRAVKNVVQEMDPDAVVREAESVCGLAGDDAVRGADHLVSCSRGIGLLIVAFFYLLLELR